MNANNKNSYLQTSLKIKPTVINRTVALARGFDVIDQFDTCPPFHRVCSEQPNIPIPNCDVTRRPLAFGRWALPKLRRELHSADRVIVIQAVNTLSDLVHDPEYNYEAIKLRIPDRLIDLLHDESAAVRERACMTLITIANLLDGKKAILRTQPMLASLVRVLNDPEPAIRMKAITLIYKISKVWMFADILVDNGFITEILYRITTIYKTDDPCMLLYIQTMENLMYCNGKFLALDYDFMTTLMNVVETNENVDILVACLKNLAVLLSTPDGKCKAIKDKLILKLYVFLHNPSPEVCEAAACCMMFATIKTEAILVAIEFPNLLDRAMVLAHNYLEPSTQKFCLQIIGNLCGHGRIRKEVAEGRMAEIENIHVADEETQRIKDNLLKNILLL